MKRDLKSPLAPTTEPSFTTESNTFLELSNKSGNSKSNFTQTSVTSDDSGVSKLTLKNKNKKSSSNFKKVEKRDNDYYLLKNKNEKSSEKKISKKRFDRVKKRLLR